MIISPVSDENPFVVADIFATGIGRVRLECLVIVFSGFKSHRELGGRIYVTKEDSGERVTSLLTRIPGVQESRHLVQPSVHIDVPARIQDNDSTRILFRNATHKIILPIREFESTIKTLPFAAV